ncbi:MAG: CPBP family intramembrane metalloprotease [Deltaproteobacteria bacterium]|nr:CPBP family intramembrane metalloprotease [Deltaproteobacteria bacterium]
MLIIYAPIAEEMFFRGILFQSLEKEYALSIAVILSSLLFMATHNGLFVGTFFLGLMTCYWTYQSRSIYPGIIFHAISNTFVLFAHHIAPNIGKISHIVFF